jgi:drug/metabolite transporter (DMT)-like permease
LAGISAAVAAAVAAVYFFWGGTYLAMRFAVETLPPFTTAGIRFVTAGAMVYCWQMARGAERPKAAHWKGAAAVGLLMLTGGNGGVMWAEQTVPSGLAAILVATVPLWMALLSWLWQGGERPAGAVAAGLATGFAGVAVLAGGAGGGAAGAGWAGYLVLVGAALAWAAGSLYSRVAPAPAAPLTAIALQMLAGGAGCLLVGLAAGEWARFEVARVSWQAVAGLGYLIVFGSVVGYSAYIWLLKAADPVLVSTYAYVNPVVAVALGWLLAGETLTGREAAAPGMDGDGI